MLGIPSTDCPTSDCPPFVCYEECAHKEAVYSSVQYVPLNSEAFFASFVDAWIADHESILKEYCEYEPDACELVLRAGLPEQIQTGFTIGEPIVCPATESTDCTDICDTLCYAVTPSGGECIRTCDLPLISDVLEAVKCVHVAGWDGIESILNVLGGSVLGVSNGAYSISLPDDYMQYLGLLSLLLPVPAGMSITAYTCKPNEVIECLIA